MHINDLITPKRVTYSLPVSSKKRLLEKICELLREDEPGLDGAAAFQSLVERERLGSTSIGEGVALPHGRLKGLKKAVGAFAVLEQEMDFGAVDHKPVKMIFALLVPENATQEHLDILSMLAKLFNDKAIRDRLLEAKNTSELYSYLIGAISN
jgi:PTS system nitrogen regulatory IIA component